MFNDLLYVPSSCKEVAPQLQISSPLERSLEGILHCGFIAQFGSFDYGAHQVVVNLLVLYTNNVLDPLNITVDCFLEPIGSPTR